MRSEDERAEHVRGVRLSAVLRRGGRLFEHADGSADTYALSSRVTRIDWFISHTWSTPRWKKFLALSYHANFSKAFASALLVGLLITVLGALGVLPFAIRDDPVALLPRHPTAPYGTALVCLAFQTALYVGTWFSKTQVFLDKACIHQTDSRRKRDGVANLNLVVLFSREFVVLDTSDYMERLWTAYELASFLTLKSYGGVVTLLPVNLYVVITILSTTLVVGSILNFVFGVMLDHSSTLYLEGLFIGVIVVLVVASVTLMRIWAKEQDKRLVRLRSFSIGDARCSVEADRVPVYENIKTMLEAQGLLETGLPMEAALRLFDDLVRHELPQHIHASGVHLHHCFAISLSFFGRALDGLASDIAGGASLRITVTRFATYLHAAAFLVPMLALTAHWFSSRCLHLSLCANIFYIIWMVLLECVIVFVWSFLHGFLLQRGQEQDFFLVALVALDSVEVAVILVVVVFQGDLLRCSRFRHVDSMMSSNLPVPIDLEGTTAELSCSVCEEESALPIPVTSLESASRGRVEGNLPVPIDFEGTTAELSCSVCEEEFALPIPVSSLGSASQERVEVAREVEEQLSICESVAEASLPIHATILGRRESWSSMFLERDMHQQLGT